MNNRTKNKDNKLSFKLTLAALGVVFGDIGTSPLYALKVTLTGLSISTAHVMGILSLIFWTLIIIVSYKYLLIIFKADNNGEGGVLALLALLKHHGTKYVHVFYLFAIIGTGFLLGDGMLTPAISVISALEGLTTLSPSFKPYILPTSCVVFLFLFYIQSRGTEKIGYLFGPLMLIWFITIAALGIKQIIETPFVLQAIHPTYALDFIYHEGQRSMLILGGIFLVVTGGEALFADIGHFGKNPIRANWFFLVLPCLLLSYFGQGAYLIVHPTTLENPFFIICTPGLNLPLIILATIATIIASQAVISAIFSLTKQAVSLGLSPRLTIIQKSEDHQGQIYVPQMNVILCIGTLACALFFKTSDNMANAYGIAVNGDMLLVDCMVAYTALAIWKWSKFKVFMIFSLFIFIDLLFFGANLHKFLTGGWLPVIFALVIGFIMHSWKTGLEYLRDNIYLKKERLDKILRQLESSKINLLPDVSAIFITDVYDKSGGIFLHFLKLSRSLPEHVLMVDYEVHNIPHIQFRNRYELIELTPEIYKLTLHYGFMDTISIPKALDKASKADILPFKVKVDSATYMVEVPTILVTQHKKDSYFNWQEKIFVFLMRNYTANLNIEFYQLPYNRTIAIGSYCIF